MGTVLSVRGLAAALAALGAGAASAAESDRHELYLDVAAGYIAASTDLTAWPDGGVGKLRHADDGFTALRVFADYRARITPTLHARIVADYLDDGASGVDVAEAYVDFKPIPRSRNQQQWRFGAFYPPFSLENGAKGWESPFTYSYSAVNTWLGEEVRPVGAEWSLRRRLEALGQAHELRAFAAGFYGNDPAATLLFWRGWSLHDRQTRLHDRLEIPDLPVFRNGVVIGTAPNSVAPFGETDDRPGAYAGVEWRYARRVLVQWARYDNRADPYSFEDSQWGWRTEFDHVAVQLSLPAGLGLIAQSMRGTTDWVSAASPAGTLSPFSELVVDEFAARFVMLTRKFGSSQRVAVRYDRFSIERPAAEPPLYADGGHAWTLSYRFEPAAARFSGGIEWLRIASRRDLWPNFYATPRAQTEEQVRLQLTYRLAAPGRR
jgi:hypothetical protein